MLALSWLYAVHGDVTWVSAILSGLAAAVIGIVASATIRIGKKALANGLMVGVAVAAFVSIFLLHVPFPLIVLGAAAIGLVGGTVAPQLFDVGVGRELEENEAVAIRDDAPRRRAHAAVVCGGRIVVLVVGLAVWLIPIAAVAVWRGPDDTLTEMGWFFSKAALVTFGGAYAVLVVRERRGGLAVRMAAARPDGGRPRPRRDHAGPAHHGARVRGVRRRVPEPRRPLDRSRPACWAPWSRRGRRSRPASSGSSWGRRTSRGCAGTAGWPRRSRPSPPRWSA